MKPSLFTPHIGLVFLSSFLLLVSCQKNSSESLDKNLTSILNTASNGKGLDYFKMPAGKDFSQIPQDPKNPITAYKVELGRLLFHETCLARSPLKTASMETYSCASCHHVDAGFQAGIAQGLSEGGVGFGRKGEGRKKLATFTDLEVDVQPIRTPSAMNMAYQEIVLWNGQFGATGRNVGTEANWTAGTPKENNNFGFQGVETQAIAGLNVHRMKIDVDRIAQMPVYPTLFALAFPGLTPEERFTRVNAGLAIAAYERTLLANESPFQKWLQGDASAMTEDEKDGAALFFGKANCVSCHTGPALNVMEFYALGMNDLSDGQYGAVNASGPKAEHKGRGGFTGKAEDMFKFKVPQLYNLKDSPFYGHGAQFVTVREVLEYKNNATPTNANVPVTQLAFDFKPLNLSANELESLRIFIEDALYDPNLRRYVPTTLPSGNCFPNNDLVSRQDRGCQ